MGAGEGRSLLTRSCGFPVRQALVSGEVSFQIFPPPYFLELINHCVSYSFSEKLFSFFLNCIGGFPEGRGMA